MVEFDQLTKNHYILSKKSNTKYFTKIGLLNSSENFNDLILVTQNGKWDSFNWEVEPVESFSDLLYERCKQLRDKYGWLILYYSGGSDSETVLQSFINAGVHLDEVVLNVFKINEDDPPLKDVELAANKLKKYSTQIPKTKMTINNLSRDVFLNFNKKQLWIDSSFNGTLGNFRRMTLPVLQELGQKVILPNTTIGHIFAETKPHLRKEEDGYYAVWGTNIGVGQWSEWFFTTLDLPNLHIKQCHMVKNYFKVNNPKEKVIVELGKVRDQIISACRNTFDNSYQPPKTTGLLQDYINTYSEDGLVIKHLKTYDSELYDIYTNATVKEMLSGVRNHSLYDRSRGELRKVKTEKFYLGK
tara:strand:+ start:4433 stop:5503 length:1071 start_codon:yes stop_codon:yes gene_type:complete